MKRTDLNFPIAGTHTVGSYSRTGTNRGAQTRVRMTDALLSLLASGCEIPTARDVAGEARVSLRLVFYHFADMESLYDAAAAALITRHARALKPVGPEGPLEERVGQTVRRGAALHEALLRLRRAARTLAPSAGRLAARFESLDSAWRVALQTTFAPELSGPCPAAGAPLEAVDAASSWEVWDRLRGPQALGVHSARSAMAATLLALLQALP